MTVESDVRLRVAELVDAGLVGDTELASSGTILDPIPVLDPETLESGAAESWFVPLAIGGRLAGFAQLRRDLELMRYSSFRRQGEAGPDLRAWIDADTIRKRAASLKRPDEVLGQPVLTYDRDPARLVWAVTATSPDGSARRIHVLGEHVSEARPAPDAPEFGRGPATG